MKIKHIILLGALFLFYPLKHFAAVTSYASIQRMYSSYLQNAKELKNFESSFSGKNQKKYLAYNLYAYHATLNTKDLQLKKKMWAIYHLNYLMDVCKSQKNPDDSTCQTFTIAIGNYKDEFKESYLDKSVYKRNKPVEFDFENDLYKLDGVVYSIKTGQKVKSSFSSSHSVKVEKPMTCSWADDDTQTKTLTLGSCPTKNQMCYGFVKCDNNESIKVSCAIENCTEQASKKCVDDYFKKNKLPANVYQNCRWVSEKSPEFPRKVVVAPACTLSDANKQIELCSRKVVCQSAGRKIERLATCSAKYCESTTSESATNCAKEKIGYYSKTYEDAMKQLGASPAESKSSIQSHQ